MATPVFAHDLITIADGETVTGWVAVGGAMFALDPDTFIQGSNSIGIPATASTLVGAVFNMGATVDLTSKHLFIWVNCAVPGKVASFAEGGVRVRVAGATATNFGEWFVGGKEIPWCAEGKWRLLVVDTGRPFDNTGGTPPAITAIQHIGVTTLTTAALMQGFAVNVDIMRYGTKIMVTGGTDGDPVTLQNIYDTDLVSDTVNNVFGIITKNRAGIFEVNNEVGLGAYSVDSGATLTITVVAAAGTFTRSAGSFLTDGFIRGMTISTSGFTNGGNNATKVISSVTATVITVTDITGLVNETGDGNEQVRTTGDTVVSSGNEAIIFQDQPCAVDYLKLKSQQTTLGTTKVKFGTGSGTGDAKVGLGGSVFSRINAYFGREYSLDLSASINLVEFFGTTVLNAKRGVTFPDATGHECISSSFVSCGQITPQQILTRKCVFSGHGLTSTGSTTLNVAADSIDTGSITVNVNATNRTYTRTAGGSGSFITDGFLVGQYVTWSGFTNANNNGVKIITAVTATVITVAASLALTTETGGGDERGRITFSFTRGSGSFLTDGFAADDSIIVSGFSTTNNNLTRVIATVTATRITVKQTTGMATESGGGDEVIQRSGITNDGAVLWDADMNIENSSFLGNVNDAATAAAIQHASSTGSPFTYDALTFSGNDFDINNSSGNSITIDATNNANPSTSKGSSVTINNPITYELTDLISGSEVRIFRVSDNVELTGTESSTTTFAYNYNYAGDVDIFIIIQKTNYEWLRINDTLGSTSVSQKIFQRLDRNYANL